MLPALSQAPELLLKAQNVAVAFFDVDGVMTDGGFYMSSEGEFLKRFHTLDGYGLQLLQRAGIVPVVVSGRDSKALRRRLDELGIRHSHLGVDDKCGAARSTLDALGLAWEQSAVIGDDWPDLPLMQRCAFSSAPPNAHAEVIAQADYVTTRQGGHGAVRDFCDVLLMARGKYASLLKEVRS